MTMESIVRDRQEETLSSPNLSLKVKGEPSYAVLGMASHLGALLEMGKKVKDGRQEDVSSEPSEPIKFTEKNIFLAAGEMSRMEQETNNSLEQELENQIAIMQAEVDAMEAVADWWAEFGPAWEAYEADPGDYDAFMEVMALLEEEYIDDPETEEQLQQIQAQGTYEEEKEEQWQENSGWHHFWGGHISDPNYFEKYSESVSGTLQEYAEEAVGSPVLFQEALANGETAFETQIEQLLLCMQILMDIVNILQDSSTNSQSALFDMEALLMDLEQLQINTNTQQSQQQQVMSQKVAENLQYNLEQLQASLAQSEKKSGGFFSWTKDLFKSVGNFFEEAGETAYWAVTGEEKKALHGVAELTKGCRVLGSAFKDVFTGDVKEGLEKLFAAILLTIVFGPLGIYLLGTEFGQDMIDLSTLYLDSIQAFTQLIGVGILEAAGDKMDASKLMELNKKLGKEMLENPALKTISDLAMIAIVASMALTGNEVLAAIMLTLFIASATGGMEKATDMLADATGNQILADLIVILAVAILSAGAGAIEGAVSVAAAEETAALAGQEAGEIAAQTAEEGGEKTSSKGMRIAKKSAAMGAFGLGSTLGSSTLALDILEATKKKDSAKFAVMVELIQVIIAAVTASIGGVGVMSESIENSAQSAEENATKLTQFASQLAVGATAVGAVSQAAQGGEIIIMGKNEKHISKYRANVVLDETTQTNIDAMIKETSEQLQQIIKAYEEIVATAFKTPAEVADAELRALIQG